MSLPTTAPHVPTKWTDRFALDLALSLEGSGEPIKELLKNHNITVTDLEQYSKDPLFEAKVRNFQKQIQENGLTFRLKARAQAEELLLTSWNIIHDNMTSPAVKADLIQWTARVAGLEPEKNAKNNGGEGNGVVININMGNAPSGPAGMQVIDHE